MRILVLFDGAGLARLGLGQAGHKCVGVELDPIKHHFSKMVGSGDVILGDAVEYYSSYAGGYLPDAQQRNRLIQWERRIYEAIGDGVPPAMSRAFGAMYR